MASLSEPSARLAVLNPRGRDPYLDYGDGPGEPGQGVHAPVNFHAYAAATRGAFYDSAVKLVRDRQRYAAAIVLIRRRCWISLDAVRIVKASGLPVIVAWKECGPLQIAHQLTGRGRALRAYGEILVEADGVVTPTLDPPPCFGPVTPAAFDAKLFFVPTPYPLESPSWDFSVPEAERSGILVGTREFRTPARNHLQAVSRAASLAHETSADRVTVINSEGKRGARALREWAPAFPPGCLRVVDGPLPYRDYMNLLATHRVVFQLDRGGVPGQVSGDCLLARTVCAGGNSTVERLAFPSLCDDGTLLSPAIRERLVRLMQDDDWYRRAVEESQERARESLGFEAASLRLAEVVSEIERGR